jgi:hypothetical protein
MDCRLKFPRQGAHPSNFQDLQRNHDLAQVDTLKLHAVASKLDSQKLRSIFASEFSANKLYEWKQVHSAICLLELDALSAPGRSPAGCRVGARAAVPYGVCDVCVHNSIWF